jgi:hypothetical protein
MIRRALQLDIWTVPDVGELVLAAATLHGVLKENASPSIHLDYLQPHIDSREFLRID